MNPLQRTKFCPEVSIMDNRPSLTWSRSSEACVSVIDEPCATIVNESLVLSGLREASNARGYYKFLATLIMHG